MTAMAVKVESVHHLVPRSLTLKDASCKPTFSDDRFAYFSFSVDSCGTIRTVGEPHLKKCRTCHLTLPLCCSSSTTTWCTRTRSAFITTATLTRGQVKHHPSILNTGERCRISDVLWTDVDVLLTVGKPFPASTWSMRQRQFPLAINQETVNFQHKLAKDTWLCKWD